MADYNAQAFAERVKEMRTAKGLTHKQLAENIDLSLSVIRLCESGKHRRGYEALCKLAIYFKTTTDYLLTGIKKNH